MKRYLDESSYTESSQEAKRANKKKIQEDSDKTLQPKFGQQRPDLENSQMPLNPPMVQNTSGFYQSYQQPKPGLTPYTANGQ